MSFNNIEHVIFLMFENRSFDSLLGWMSHPRYANHPVDGLKGPLDGLSLADPAYTNTGVNHTYQPFFEESDCECQADLPHGRDQVATQLAWDAMAQQYSMTGFAQSFFDNNANMGQINAPTPENLRMLGPSAAPVTRFLAENFLVCDRWFTTIPTDTHPNRVMALAGYTEIDSTSSFEPDHRLVFDWANGLSPPLPWAVYGNGFSFMSLMRIMSTITDPHYLHFDDFAADFQDMSKPFPAVVHLEPEFADDPTVSHPNDNHPPLPMGPGEQFLLDIYTALQSNPDAIERWNRTMLVVYYDEHGGYFDHVPPLWVETPCGRPAEQTQWPKFVNSGPRVPAIVVSPLLEAGVYSKNLDHTSLLRFLADRFSPGHPYSSAVKTRHDSATADLHSLADLPFLAKARATPPPPNVGQLRRYNFTTPRNSTPGQKAFIRAHATSPKDRP